MSQIAIVKTGSKQYKVEVGDIIKVEKLESQKKSGEVELEDILYGKKVLAKVLETKKSPKVKILKFHAKKRYKRVNGHRQTLSQIKIESIK